MQPDEFINTHKRVTELTNQQHPVHIAVLTELSFLIVHGHQHNNGKAGKEHCEAQQNANNGSNKAVFVAIVLLQVTLNGGCRCSWNVNLQAHSIHV